MRKRKTEKVSCMQQAVQDSSSMFCGFFSLVFVALFEVNLHPIGTVSWHLEGDLLQNDTLCAKYINTLLDECHQKLSLEK